MLARIYCRLINIPGYLYPRQINKGTLLGDTTDNERKGTGRWWVSDYVSRRYMLHTEDAYLALYVFVIHVSFFSFLFCVLEKKEEYFVH